MIGEGPRAVPGTLSVPRGGGQAPVPGVVLLAGSGPLDQDETIGRNKPLKDLAWGLASAGTAVLRFEKVTHAHPALVAGDATFTLTDEYVPHGVAALQLLRDHPGVDPARVFLAGHSQGGTVAPRVAARAPVAGLVILAGGAQPLHEAMVRQFRYLASLEPAQGADLDAIARQVAAVDDPGLSEATPASGLPFGVPAAYWLDLRGYNPAAAAAELGKPVLHHPGRPRLPGDRRRRPVPLEGRARRQAGHHDPGLPGGQPPVLPRLRPLLARRVRARAARRPRRSSPTSPAGSPRTEARGRPLEGP